MKKLLLLLLFIPLMSISQNDHPTEFKYELTDELKNGSFGYVKGYLSKTNNYIVFESLGSIEDNYLKIIDYINFSYRNPEKVIAAKSENKYIRINGFAENLYKQWKGAVTFDFDIRYSLTFYVKKDRIKLEINNLEWFDSGIGWRSITDGIIMHTKSGKPRKSMVGTTDVRLENYFNNIKNQLISFKNNDLIDSDKDDW